MERAQATRLSGEIKVILKKVSRTLYLSVAILPEPVRTSMGLGYLLCRALDTAVDTPGIPADEKLRILKLARSLDSAAARDELLSRLKPLAAATPHQGERELLLKFGKILNIYASLSEEERAPFSDVVSGVAAGMEMDVNCFPGGEPAALKTAADLERYCALIGGQPGVFWARLYRGAIRRSIRSRGAFPSESDAEMIGSALQMTNILKDMASDIRIGRCYLPQEELDTRNMKPAELLKPSNMARIRELTAKWTFWALDRLDQSERFISSIPKTELALRAAVIWPVYWAMDTLEQTTFSNLLDPAGKPKVARSRIYRTIAATPPLLLSNTAFSRGYRFRRETLIGSIANFQGRTL